MRRVSASCAGVGRGIRRIRHHRALDKCIHSRDNRSLVGTAVCSLASNVNAAAGRCNFFSLALPRNRRRLHFSCINCTSGIRGLGLSGSVRRGVTLHISNGLPRIIMSNSLGSPLLAARANGHSFSGGSVGARFTLVSSPSIIGALRHIDNITRKRRLTDKLCIRNNGNSRGLFLVSNAPLCGAGRTLKLFSDFGTSIIGGISFCGDNFPTQCNKELSSIISIHATSKGVGRFRNTCHVKLLSTDIRFRKPVRGNGASCGVNVHHS